MIYLFGFGIGRFFSNNITRFVVRKLSDLCQSFFSGWISRRFLSVGNEFSIKSPCLLNGGKYISIGTNFSSGRRLRLEAIHYYNEIFYSPEIFIGNNVKIEEDCHIGAINKIEIGNNVLIAGKVFITDHFHGNTTLDSISLPPEKRNLLSKGGVKIGNNVWIGEGVTVMPGVTIGDNSIIGANAVVTTSFPNNSVIIGNPAKLQKNIND